MEDYKDAILRIVQYSSNEDMERVVTGNELGVIDMFNVLLVDGWTSPTAYKPEAN